MARRRNGITVTDEGAPSDTGRGGCHGKIGGEMAAGQTEAGPRWRWSGRWENFFFYSFGTPHSRNVSSIIVSQCLILHA